MASPYEKITLTREAGSNTWIVQRVVDAVTESRFTVNEMHGIEIVGRGSDEDAGVTIRTLELVVQGASR
jgi:hypothetical protein